MTANHIQHALKNHGLLCHTFAYNTLPKHLKDLLSDAEKHDYNNKHVSLIANAGPDFWSCLLRYEERAVLATPADAVVKNRVDAYSVHLVHELLTLAGIAGAVDILYPGTHRAPLMQLGELAHWSMRSPLGLGLHPTYGPWIAYRALIVANEPLTVSSSTSDSTASSSVHYASWSSAKPTGEHRKPSTAASPCLSCSAPCVAHCPAGAVSVDNAFAIGVCADYRLSEHNRCAEQCHARNACPAGARFRYSDEQRAYHMTHALHGLLKWSGRAQE